MSIEMLQRYLIKAEARLRQSEHHILHQQKIVDGLEAHGHDARLARDLLSTFLEMQITHRADRDRLVKEIQVEQAVNRRGPIRP